MMSKKPFQEADSPEEILDVVNEQDEVIGQATRRELYANGNWNFRVVHAFIKNSDGKLWIPRRVDTKKLFPNALDFSVAGHVESGETYEEALQKEAAEEVGMQLTPESYREIGYFWPQRDGVGVFQKVYEILSDTTPDYDKSEFSSYEWLTPQELVERAEHGEDMKDDIPKLIKRCYLSQ